MKRDEYKGEKILGGMIGRLVPPAPQYPDCMCHVFLTAQYLYVLEDNFDGTFETHFTFAVRQIREIAMVKNTKPSNQSAEWTPSPVGYSVVALMGLVGGLLILPGKGRQDRAVTYLMIHYDDGSELGDRLYFNELQTSSKGLIAAFWKARKALP